MSKEMRRAALLEALLPVTRMLSAVLGMMMAFPPGQWHEEWEFEFEQDATTGHGVDGRACHGLVEREGTNRHAQVKAREHLADVLRDTVTVTGVRGLNVIMAESRAQLHAMLVPQPGSVSECHGGSWEAMEGYIFMLYSVSKDYSRFIEAGHDVEWGVDDLTACLAVLARGLRGEAVHPRLLETQLWTLSSLAPVLARHPRAQQAPTPPSHRHPLSSSPQQPSAPVHGDLPPTPALMTALEICYISLDSARPATARGAAVAWMKIAERCASHVVGLGAEAYAKPLEVFRSGA